VTVPVLLAHPWTKVPDPAFRYPTAARWSQAVAAMTVTPSASPLDVATDAVPGVVPVPSAVEPVCDVCPHLAAAHDRIGRRFCQATLGSAITRGCICRTA